MRPCFRRHRPQPAGTSTLAKTSTIIRRHEKYWMHVRLAFLPPAFAVIVAVALCRVQSKRPSSRDSQQPSRRRSARAAPFPEFRSGVTQLSHSPGPRHRSCHSQSNRSIRGGVPMCHPCTPRRGNAAINPRASAVHSSSKASHSARSSSGAMHSAPSSRGHIRSSTPSNGAPTRQRHTSAANATVRAEESAVRSMAKVGIAARSISEWT